MQNPFTTIPGILTFVAAVLNLVAHLLNGSLDAQQAALSFTGMTAGIGLIKAQDGKI